ncbi:hypothetical protein MPLDJ20_60093 [Mesorhizobium plurifarium]|uniref:Uncharacterized protein n=1 Tax=Mesorhizobium plurifarium TaxID=69974 RepID=A0A090FGE8_MESPL|nr:hypothetical protein MPLDJ20_60093 [Mesorhizobium plurifarium]
MLAPAASTTLRIASDYAAEVGQYEAKAQPPGVCNQCFLHSFPTCAVEPRRSPHQKNLLFG